MEQIKNDRLLVCFGTRSDGTGGVLFALPNGVTVDVNGEPRQGMVFLPSQARELAFNLLVHAEAISASPGTSLWLPTPEPKDPNREKAIDEFLGAEIDSGPKQ